MTPVRLELAAPQSRVKHSTTEPLCSCKKTGSYGNKLATKKVDNGKVTIWSKFEKRFYSKVTEFILSHYLSKDAKHIT